MSFVSSRGRRINGDWACEQPLTLKDVLKTWYNFSGFVVSDWGACHSTAPSINAGLDLEMPKDVHFTEENIMAALEAKNITTDRERMLPALLVHWPLPERVVVK